MKCLTWTTSGLSAGLQVQTDEKLGRIVFLGEDGRGRRYEKVGLSRRNPADIENGRVMNANPVKIVLPAKDGKPEKSFCVLERPTAEIKNALVRINSYGGYVRGGQGGWKNITGKSETLVSGYGAFGDAGRIGNWDDGLVVIHPGDVVKIHPSCANSDSVIWMDEIGQIQTASWQDYETIMAIHKAEATIADAEEKQEGLLLLVRQMPCFSFRGGEITLGLKLEKGTAGASVRLGEDGRGRKLVEVPIVGELLIDGVLSETAVADLGKGIFGLIQSKKSEPNTYLVRVCTEQGYTRRGDGSWELWKGNSTVVTKGNGADGGAGRIGSWDDGLLILHSGDVVRVRPSGDGPAYALFAKDGKVQVEAWTAWKIKDAKCDPKFYIAKGTAPWGYVPAEWISHVVTIMVMGECGMSGGKMIPSYTEGRTGELISIEPLVLNLGWDGQDRHDEIIQSAVWVILTDKKVRRLEGEEAEKRKLIRVEAEELHKKAIAVTEKSCFDLAETNLHSSVQSLSREQNFDTMPTEGWDSLTSWVERAKEIFEKFTATEQELKALEQRQNSGEVLVDFSVWHRRGGATNQGDGWVIRSDGSLREPDERDVPRHKMDGIYRWHLVAPEELAIKWSKAYTAAPHKFEVAKLPIIGLAKEQIATVERLEREISERFCGSIGMSGATSPEIGNGWGFSKKCEYLQQNEVISSEDNSFGVLGEALKKAGLAH